MLTAITIVHISACVFLVIVVLIQAGKGADISASLGGSSQTIFGSSGGANFFTRFTAVMAGLFMLTSLGLTYLGNQTKRSVFEGQAIPQTAPAEPIAPGASNTTGNTKGAAPTAPAAPAKATTPAAKAAPAAAPAPSRKSP